MSRKLKARTTKRRRNPAPLLTLAMITRDEEQFIDGAIRSARDWVDEVVVVDTGSSDRTVEIARSHNAWVTRFDWCDDFAAARNAMLRAARGRWLIVLDADERCRVTDPKRLRATLAARTDAPEILQIRLRNLRLDGRAISAFWAPRVFPRHPAIRYAGRIHERLVGTPPDLKLPRRRLDGLTLDHVGYDPLVYTTREKSARTLRLLEAEMREHPSALTPRYYLGREYLKLGRVDEAIATLAPTVVSLLEEPQRGPLIDTVNCLLKAYAAVPGRSAEARLLVESALRHEPTHPDLLFTHGQLLAGAGDNCRAIAALEKAIAHRDTPRSSEVALAEHAWQAHEALGHQYWAMARYPDAYRAYLSSLDQRPDDAPGEPRLLNSLCGLALELGDTSRTSELLARLLDHPHAPLGMYLFAVQQKAAREGCGSARAMLATGIARCPRLVRDPEYEAIASRLTVDTSVPFEAQGADYS